MAGQRYPRAARLSGKPAFDAVFAAPMRLNGACFRLHARASAAAPRLGLAITRRTAPRAVDRNRLRRHARESFRRERTQLHGYDIVLVAKPAAPTASAARLRQDLAQLFQRLRALNADAAAGKMPG
jgi:ribonuclease P protein component